MSTSNTIRQNSPDLIGRAHLAINCLTHHCDKSRGYLPYFYTRLNTRHGTYPPAAALAVWSYGDGLGRSVDALTLLRAMTGDHIDHDADRHMRATLLSLLDIDGLSWCPAEPWAMDTPHTRPAWLQQGTLLALTSLWQFTGDGEYRRLAELNIQAVAALSIEHDGHAEFPGDVFTREGGWEEPGHDPMHKASVFATSIAMPLMRFYRLTKYGPALHLASNLINWALRDHDDGERIFALGHFHSQSRLLTALLLRGVETGNTKDMDQGEQLYLKARALGTQSGWFPEQINNAENNRSNLAETCCLTDMIESAIVLAQHKDSIYWNDVERYARNHLMAHQIIDTDWFDEMDPADIGIIGYDSENLTPTAGLLSSNEIRQWLIGGFAGWGATTAMSDDSTYANTNQHCCNAAGARALYDVWRYAVTDNNDNFSVNLYLDRKHAVADISIDESGESGVLSVTMKQPRSLFVRLPENVQPSEISIHGTGNQSCHPVRDNFLDLGLIDIGVTVKVEYPLKSRTTTEIIAPGTFTFHWRGATVVDAEPIQKVRPLFGGNVEPKVVPFVSTALEREFNSI